MNTQSNVNITFHRSSPDAFYVNSFIITLDAGIVVIDTQFILPEAEKLAQAIKQVGKPLLGVLLTHPHPDHVNGTIVLRRDWPTVPVYATDATAKAIAETSEPKRKQWKPLLGDAYPDDVVLPDQVLNNGDIVEIGDLRFQFTDVGALESVNESIIALPDHNLLFAGDLFYNAVHPWLVEGRSIHWKETLTAMEQHLSAFDRIYVGHGNPSDGAGVRGQIEYMNFFFSLVSDVLNRTDQTDKDGSAAAKDRVITAIKNKYPEWPLEGLIAMNYDAMLKELASDSAR